MKKILTGLIIWSAFISLAFASDWNLPGVSIISRNDRVANDTIRFSSIPYADRKARLKSQSEEATKRLEETNLDEFFDKQKTEYEQAMRNDYLQTNFQDEQIVDSVVYDEGKNYLKRPESYHYKKTKIIIHHTAGDTSAFTGKTSVIAYLNDIFKFHTLTRGRGDIGYNFLVDPYGNIYEGRAGGDSVIGAHTNWNNTPSVGISLMGNFDKQQPTKEQIKSLVILTTALSKKYAIDPTATTEYHKQIQENPYMQSYEASTIAGHRDAGITSCPGKNIYALLPQIKKLVVQNLAQGVLVSSSADIKGLPAVTQLLGSQETLEKGLNMLKNRQSSFDVLTAKLKRNYISSHKVALSSTPSKKITAQISTSEVKKMMEGNINVLLYELSAAFTSRDVACDGNCKFAIDGTVYYAATGNIEVAEGGVLLSLANEKHLGTKIIVDSTTGGLVKIENYKRVSYYKIPRNTFHGQLIFGKEKIKNLNANQFQTQYTVINSLLFTDYLKGIVETNDTEHTEKIKAMNLISKGYALFYMNTKNHHPSIPEGVGYTAIDSPEMFQKYVGAGLEKTLKKVPLLVKNMKNEIIVYKGYLPILPYFSCSAGFTRSAEDRWGRSDTSYLPSRIDFEKCNDFNGHGVGLSGKGAQYLAEKGWTYKEILHYYYPGTEIISLP